MPRSRQSSLIDLPEVYELMHTGKVTGRYVLKMPDPGIIVRVQKLAD